MKFFKTSVPVIILIVMILSLGGISSMAQQQPGDYVTFKSFEPGCSSTTYNWNLNELQPNDEYQATATLRIDGDEVDSFEGSMSGFSGSFTYPELTGTHTITLRIFLNRYETSESISQKISCVEDIVPEDPGDGRICFAPGQAPAAVYLYGSGAFDIYAINGDDNGELVIRMTSQDLDEVPSNPETNLVVKESNRIVNIKFIRLSTGENQINVGPEPTQGKVWECVFDSKSVTVTDFFTR
jgi:hypothetical protein